MRYRTPPVFDLDIQRMPCYGSKRNRRLPPGGIRRIAYTAGNALPKVHPLMHSMRQTSPFWDSLDAVLIINLAHRTDRWERITAMLRDLVPAEKIHRLDAVRGITMPGYLEQPWFTDKTPEKVAIMRAGSAGCIASHRKAIETARDNGWKNVLILEDDANLFDTLEGRKGDMIAEIIRDPQAWDIFYLGFYQRHFKYAVCREETIDGEPFRLVRMGGPIMLHAYIVNERIYQPLLDGMPTQDDIWEWNAYYGSIDAWMQNYFTRDRNIKVWGTLPRLCMQIADYSDLLARPRTVEEEMGIHRTVFENPVTLASLEASLPRSIWKKMYDAYKYGGRLFRHRRHGFTK